MSTENKVNERTGRRRRGRAVEEAEVVNEVEEVDDVEEADEDLDEERGVSERKGKITPGRRNQIAENAPTGNIVTRNLRSILEYIDGVRSELMKVAWPTREETTRLTRIVLGTTIVTSLILGGIGLVFTELFRFGLDSPAIMIGIILVGAVVAVVVIRRSNNATSPY